MSKIQFTSSTGKVHIAWNFDGDYLVQITAKLQGFSGHSAGHVVRENFEKFAKDVSKLNMTRKGEAKFESARPDEFGLTLKSVDGVGHLGVFGKLKFSSFSNKTEIQRLEFALEFPPEQIESAVMALNEITP